jgi:hypothetical protein
MFLTIYLSDTDTNNDNNNLDIISMLYAFSRYPIRYYALLISYLKFN